MRQQLFSAVLAVLVAALVGACATAEVGNSQQPAAAVAPASSGELVGQWRLEWSHTVTDGLNSGKYYLYSGQATLVRDGEVLRAKVDGQGWSVYNYPISLWGTLEGRVNGQALELSVETTDRLMAAAAGKDRTCTIEGQVKGQINGPKIVLKGKGEQSGPMDCARSVDLELTLTRR